MISRIKTLPRRACKIRGFIMSIDKLERNNRRLDAAAAAGSADTGINAGVSVDAGNRRQQYAAELAAHFQAYVDWATDHWPVDEQPLDPASFSRSREELLAVCRQAGVSGNDDADPSTPGGAQFVPVTPMPWP
jgi:hypothetical protein